MTDAELGKTIRELLSVSEGIVFLTAHDGIACLGILDRLDEATAVVLYEFAAEAHETARADRYADAIEASEASEALESTLT